VFIICNFCYFLLYTPLCAINAESVNRLTDATATLTFTDMVYLHPAMQCSTLKNATQQELFNIIKTPFGTDFLVWLNLLLRQMLPPKMCHNAHFYGDICSHTNGTQGTYVASCPFPERFVSF